MWISGKRYAKLMARNEESHEIALIALKEARSVREDFNSRYAEAVDKKYEFGEILECLDDIMTHLNL